MSITAMSGLSWLINGRASAAVAASPHTLRSASSSITARRPWRTTGWSSTSSTRRFVGAVVEVEAGGSVLDMVVMVEHAGDGGAAAIAAGDVDCRADHS